MTMLALNGLCDRYSHIMSVPKSSAEVSGVPTKPTQDLRFFLLHCFYPKIANAGRGSPSRQPSKRIKFNEQSGSDVYA